MTDDGRFVMLPDRPLLRVDEVAAFFSVSERTIRNWYAEGKLSGCTPNGIMRLYRQSVVELVINSEGKLDCDAEEVSCDKIFRRGRVISRGIKD